jgi:hypothetical protein
MSITIDKSTGNAFIEIECNDGNIGMELYLRRQAIYDLLTQRKHDEFGLLDDPIYYGIQLLKEMDMSPDQIQQALKRKNNKDVPQQT